MNDDDYKVKHESRLIIIKYLLQKKKTLINLPSNLDTIKKL